MAIAVCYIFLLVFTWVYMGDTITCTIPALGVDFVLFSPFKSLRWISFYYFLVGVFSFIVWIIGTILLQLSVFCEATAPGLYKFTVFLIVTYWMGFVIVILLLTKFFFGSNIAKMIKETPRASTIDEVEERLFRAKFDQYDLEKENRIPNEKVPLVLEDLQALLCAAQAPLSAKTSSLCTEDKTAPRAAVCVPELSYSSRVQPFDMA